MVKRFLLWIKRIVCDKHVADIHVEERSVEDRLAEAVKEMEDVEDDDVIIASPFMNGGFVFPQQKKKSR